MQSVKVTDEPLEAWNMAVDVSDSYFVTGGDADDAVWVHNCPPPYSRNKYKPVTKKERDRRIRPVPIAARTLRHRWTM